MFDSSNLSDEFSAEDKADVSVASSGDIPHHSLLKRNAESKRKGKKKRSKKGGKRRKRRKGRKKDVKPLKRRNIDKIPIGKHGRKGGDGRKANKQGNRRRGRKGGNRRGRKTVKNKKDKINKKSMADQRQSINYTQCAMKMKEFASRIKKAGNLVRQSKRITDFMKINNKKKEKVIKLRFCNSHDRPVIVERKFQQYPGDSYQRPGREQDQTSMPSDWGQLYRYRRVAF